jgi:hypothetical protein
MPKSAPVLTTFLIGISGMAALSLSLPAMGAPSRAPAAVACSAQEISDYSAAREAAKLPSLRIDPAMCCALIKDAKVRCSIADGETGDYRSCCDIRKARPCTPDSAEPQRGWPLSQTECASIGTCMAGTGCSYKWSPEKNRIPPGFCMSSGGDKCPGQMYITYPSANDQMFNCDGQRRFANARIEACSSGLEMVAAAGCEIPGLPVGKPVLQGGDKLCK